jgi:hypothetical protein
MKRPTRTRLYQCRREVADDALQGWTQTASARCMRAPQGTGSRDLAAMREFPVCEIPLSDFEPQYFQKGLPRRWNMRIFRIRVVESSWVEVNVAHRHGVVTPKGVFVTPKYRLCATPGLWREFCVSRSCVRRSIDFRAIASDRKKLAKSRKCCDASAGLDGGSGELRSLAVKSQSFEKLRMCAMRHR